MESDADTRKRLRALAPFAHRFQSPGFDFSTEASEFMGVCNRAGWIRPDFDWSEWMISPEAIRLRDCPAAMEEASPDQLARLLTVLIRQDRFVEGALNRAFESGLLLRILKRIATLAGSPE